SICPVRRTFAGKESLRMCTTWRHCYGPYNHPHTRHACGRLFFSFTAHLKAMCTPSEGKFLF
ncbi:hypothetical protein L9F63_026438, partial [Diploptera punctata]